MDLEQAPVRYRQKGIWTKVKRGRPLADQGWQLGLALGLQKG